MERERLLWGLCLGRDVGRLRLLVVFSVAVLSRLFAAAMTLTIAVDGVLYIRQARLLTDGHIRDALAIPYHIGYAAVVAALHRLLMLPNTPEHWELAGQVVSLLAGFFTVLLVWRLTEEVFGERAGFWGGLAAALASQLVRFSAQVRSEALYFLLLVAGALFAVRFLKEMRLSYAAFSGLMLVFAYLVRPEALLVGLVFFGFCVARVVRCLFGKMDGLWRVGLGILVMGGVVAAFASPYILAIRPFTAHRKQKGRLKLTLKRDPLWLFKTRLAKQDFVTEEEGPKKVTFVPKENLLSFVKEYSAKLWKGVRILPEVLHPVIAVVALFGFWAFLRRFETLKGTFRLGAWFLVACGVGYFLVVSLFGATHRYMTQPAIFALPFFGAGVVWLRWVLRFRRRLVWGLCVVAVVLLFGRLAVARHRCYLAEREAGLWLRRQVPPFARIACRLPRLRYYADLQLVAEIQSPSKGGFRLRRPTLKWVLKKGCELVAVDAAYMPKDDLLYLLNHKKLRFMARFKRNPQDIYIFRVLP